MGGPAAKRTCYDVIASSITHSLESLEMPVEKCEAALSSRKILTTGTKCTRPLCIILKTIHFMACRHYGSIGGVLKVLGFRERRRDTTYRVPSWWCMVLWGVVCMGTIYRVRPIVPLRGLVVRGVVVRFEEITEHPCVSTFLSLGWRKAAAGFYRVEFGAVVLCVAALCSGGALGGMNLRASWLDCGVVNFEVYRWKR